MLKKFAGVAVFVFALGAAIAVTKYYAPPEAPTPAPSRPAPVSVNVPPPPIPPPAPGTASKVSYKAQFVTLDFAKRKSYTALALERDRSQPAPGKLWVWTCFYVPTAGGAAGQCRSGDPVEISQPFASGDKTNVTATASCPWCADAGAPTSGYYGRVSISTVSAEAARLVESQIDERAQAIPVVVQAASGRARSN